MRNPSFRTPRLLVAGVLAMLLAGLTFAAGSASAAVFPNAAPITIPSQGHRVSQVEVSGMHGPINDMALTLFKFGHANPRDVDMLLVSPSGDASVVMSDVCDAPVEDYVWSFPSNGTHPFMGDACPHTLYRPTDIGPLGEDFWLGAPPPQHQNPYYYLGLNKFHGEDANGTWKLYIADDTAGNGGDIESGWSLRIETGPAEVRVPGTGTSGPADPYPVTQTISGVDGVITDADVVVRGISHHRTSDLDVLLVGPRGQRVMLASDACGASVTQYQYWRFDDQAAGAIPADGGCNGHTSASKVYRPADHEPGESLPAPAPQGPYSTTLSDLDLTDPNGEWRLYVNDDADGNGGFVDRFALALTTRPRARVAFRQAAVTLVEGQTGSLTLTRSAPAALGAGSVTVTSAPRSATSGEDFTPVSTTVEFAVGETTKTVPLAALSDGRGEGTETFAVTIGGGTGDAEVAPPATAVVTIRDRVPGPGAGPGGGPGPAAPGADRDAPVISRVRLAPARFAVARRRTARTAARGTTIRYALSEPATVSLRFERAGRPCRRRGARGCRYVPVGTLRRSGRPGANRVAFSGRIARRALRRGRHRLIVTATDGAGNRATSRPKRFRITR